MKYGLGLTTETHLFGIVTTFSLGKVGSFAGLVLCYLVVLMLTAFLTGTECFTFLGNVDHFGKVCIGGLTVWGKRGGQGRRVSGLKIGRLELYLEWMTVEKKRWWRSCHDDTLMEGKPPLYMYTHIAMLFIDFTRRLQNDR